jgi:hypothetical protein
MEKIKSVNFINDCYGERTMDIVRNEEGSIEFHEMWNEQAEGEKVPSKIVNWITVKWCAENGKLNPEEINEYVGETVTDASGEHEITKIKKKSVNKTPVIAKVKKKAPVADSLEGATVTYKGRSKKITSEVVTVISDNGTKCKIKDDNGNEALVAKSTLKTI